MVTKSEPTHAPEQKERVPTPAQPAAIGDGRVRPNPFEIAQR